MPDQERGPIHQPRERQQRIASVKATDPAYPIPFAVVTYESRKNLECAIVGQLQRRTLGLLEGGRFRPFAPGTGGACGDLTRLPYFVDSRDIRGKAPRTLIYGRASDRVHRIKVTHAGETKIVAPASDGAFLFVYEGIVPPSEFDMLGVDREGRKVKSRRPGGR